MSIYPSLNPNPKNRSREPHGKDEEGEGAQARGLAVRAPLSPLPHPLEALPLPIQSQVPPGGQLLPLSPWQHHRRGEPSTATEALPLHQGAPGGPLPGGDFLELGHGE